MATRGRPAFKPTAAQRQQVEQMISCSMSRGAIARVIGIDVDTLVKHFGEELEHGVERKRSQVIAMLFKSAKSGNVTAQKKLEEMTGVSAAAVAMSDAGLIEKQAPVPKRGKKEEASMAADRVAADGVFAVPSAPKLVVDNR